MRSVQQIQSQDESETKKRMRDTQPVNILNSSPLDASAITQSRLVQIQQQTPPQHFVPSRFNAVARGAGGELVVWNSFTGRINSFEGARVNEAAQLLDSGCNGPLDGIAKYLADRGFLVPESYDEYKVLQLAAGKEHYRGDVLELFLLASEDCNFRCRYCYESFQRGTMAPQVRTGVRNLLQKRIADLTRLSIAWFGGEPLYGFPAVAEIAPFAKQLADRHGVHFSSHMTTNGYLLSPQIADQLLEWNVNAFQITIDGVQEVHDRARPLRTGAGSFDTIISNLRSLKKRTQDFLVRLRVNFDNENRPELEPLLDLLARDFAKDERFTIAFYPVSRFGGPNDRELDVCRPSEAYRFRIAMMDAARERGVTPAGTLREASGLGTNVCYAARPYSFVIGADGKLMKCTVALDKEDNNVVGRITEAGNLEIDPAKFAIWVEPAFQSDTTCQQCKIVGSCQGMACPLDRIRDGIRPCGNTPKPTLNASLLQAFKYGPAATNTRPGIMLRD